MIKIDEESYIPTYKRTDTREFEFGTDYQIVSNKKCKKIKNIVQNQYILTSS